VGGQRVSIHGTCRSMYLFLCNKESRRALLGVQRESLGILAAAMIEEHDWSWDIGRERGRGDMEGYSSRLCRLEEVEEAWCCRLIGHPNLLDRINSE